MSYIDKKVSVIIPCFNGEKLISAAIESVLNQTYNNIEVIIIDDGSTDTSEQVINHFLAERNVFYFKHSSNRGIPATRNDGIKHAQGDYIAFLDQDDLWFPTKIEDQMNVFKIGGNKHIGLVFSDILFLEDGLYSHRSWPHKRIPTSLNEMPIKEVFCQLFLHNFIPIITALISRECLEDVGQFNDGILGGADDWELMLRIASKYKLYYLESILAVHRLHSNNYSDRLKFFNDELDIIEKLVRKEPELMSLKNKKYGNIHYALGAHCQSICDYINANRHYWKAIKYDPINMKYILKWLINQHQAHR